MVRVPRRVFPRLLPERPTPERCVEAYHLQRTQFEKIADRKLRRRQLTEDGSRSAGAICDRCQVGIVPTHEGVSQIDPGSRQGCPLLDTPPHGSGRAQFEHPAPTLGV